ncbi:MAG TPA: GIY-YIG nuclease family protein [Patescibacteria group bacterium]|nr:GIY-YIG nuclease family protein [Patescibacteria group bacterium]
MYYVYILKLKDKTYYHGFSSNLKQRINEHEKGYVAQTKNMRPFELIYYSGFKSKIKALDFEKYLKTNSGFAFRNKRLV